MKDLRVKEQITPKSQLTIPILFHKIKSHFLPQKRKPLLTPSILAVPNRTAGAFPTPGLPCTSSSFSQRDTPPSSPATTASSSYPKSAAALLHLHEEEDTFVWLFTEWVKCMNGVAPHAIITDQDKAICNAIQKVFPNTRHRYCKWHIGKHMVDHLLSLQKLHGEEFANYFNRWWHSKTIETCIQK
ncbi:uncharacterized protein LOC109833512 [Asparagus officinalis]|uniref:uncharacterized protein LOC109833512 n=1 Tax=Asparagus officinalis TaxID=4686 RepID=UPI00098E83C8|nr:uncharacterized protein LOC109833512 [Asparagus officinalis]